MRSDLDCRGPRRDAAGKRLRPVAPDSRPHPALLGARALDGERAFNNYHHLVDPIPLAQRPALDAVLVSLAARRAVDPLPRRGTALSHQPGRCRRHQLAPTLLRKQPKDLCLVRADICDRPRRYVAQRSHLLLVARSALLRIDVDADRSLRHRRDHKIAATSRLLRCLLSYLQSGNGWKQSTAIDVGLIEFPRPTTAATTHLIYNLGMLGTNLLRLM